MTGIRAAGIVFVLLFVSTSSRAWAEDERRPNELSLRTERVVIFKDDGDKAGQVLPFRRGIQGQKRVQTENGFRRVKAVDIGIGLIDEERLVVFVDDDALQ